MAANELECTFFHEWQIPLPGLQPCGEDASFTPEYDAIKEEIEKSSSIHADQITNWESVLEKANIFLTTQSKDLWIICYAIRAVYEKHGLTFCVSSIHALNKILETFWEDLHPLAARPMRRAAPLQWLCARLENIIPAANFPDDQGQTAQKLKDELTVLHNFLGKKLGDLSPSFSPIIRALPAEEPVELAPSTQPTLAELLSTPIQPAKPVNQAAQSSSAIIAPAAVHSGSSDGLIPHQNMPQVFRALSEQGQRLALHYLQHDMTDWRVYMLNRAVLWCSIIQLPQVNQAGISQLRPIPRDKALTYSAAVDAKRFGEILPQLEMSAAKLPFWFDGHHMVAKCLEGLKAFEALNFLQDSACGLIDMFPELINYKYYDGTPFASPKTIQWLETLKGKKNSGSDDTIQLSFGNTADHCHETLLCEALAIFHDKDFNAGLKHLGQILPSKSRSAIAHGLLIARYCLTVDRQEAALNILHELYGKLEEWNLLDWEPALSTDILGLLISTASSLRREMPEALIRNLYWLNADVAISTLK